MLFGEGVGLVPKWANRSSTRTIGTTFSSTTFDATFKATTFSTALDVSFNQAHNFFKLFSSSKLEEIFTSFF
jgi:hypothetical protein